jgi:hypothetical protein
MTVAPRPHRTAESLGRTGGELGDEAVGCDGARLDVGR